MAIYEVKTPSGEILEIKGPDNAPQDQILSFARQYYESQQKAPEELESSPVLDNLNLTAQGFLSTIQSITDVFGADNPVSQFISDNNEALYGMLSAAKKKDREEISRIMEEAADKGTLEQMTAALEALSKDPSGLVSQGLGSVAPFLIGGLFGAGAKALTALGVGSGVGITKDTMFSAVEEELLKNGVSPEEAREIALESQSYTGDNIDQIAIGGLGGFLATRLGVEKALIPQLTKNIVKRANKKGVVQRAVQTGLAEFATEAGQAGAEAVAGNVAKTRAGFETPTFQGAVGQGTLEGLVGGILGAGAGAISPDRGYNPNLNNPPPQPEPEPEQYKTDEMPQIEQNAPPLGLPAPAGYEGPPVPEFPVTPEPPLTRQQRLEQQRIQKQQEAVNLFNQNGEQQLFNQPLGQPQPATPFPAPPTTTAPGLDSNVNPTVAADLENQRIQKQQQAMGDQSTASPFPMAPVTPSQVNLRQTTAPTGGAPRPMGDADRARIDQIDAQATAIGKERQATIDRLRQQQKSPSARDRQEATKALIDFESQPAEARFVDLQPMDIRTATGRLNALKAEDPNANYAVVPHPSTPDSLAIELRPRAKEQTPVESEQGRSFNQRMAEQKESQARLEAANAQAGTLDLSPLDRQIERLQTNKQKEMSKEEKRQAQERLESASAQAMPLPKPPDPLENLKRIVKEKEEQAQQTQAEGNPKSFEEQRFDQALLQALKNVEERGGVASPYEAQIIDLANIGSPYDRVDNGLSPQGTVDQRLTQATGIELRGRPREAVTEADRIANERNQAMQEETERKAQAAPDPNRVIEALRKPAATRDAEDISTLNIARQRYAPSDMNIFEKEANNPGTLTGNEVSRLDNIQQFGPRFSLEAEPSPELKDLRDDIRRDLLATLRRFGLEKIGLRLVDSIDGGAANGMYLNEIITVAMDSDNPMGVMRHEIIHALKELGAFTTAEWNILSKRAREQWIDQFIGPDLLERYRQVYLEQNNGDPEGFQEYIEEEAIAEAFKHFEQTKPPAGMVGNIFNRLKKMFTAIKEFFTKHNLTAEDIFLTDQIFTEIETGKKTRRGEKYESLPKFSLRDIPKDLANIPGIAKLTKDEALSTSLPLRTGKGGTEAFDKMDIGGKKEVVEFLENRRLQSGLPKLDLENQEDRDILAKMMTAEALAAIKVGGDASQWYDQTIKDTMALASVKYPELATDPYAQAAFKMAMAISSQNMNVEENIKFAFNAYGKFRETKLFPEKGSGKAASSMKSNFELANEMIEVLGLENLTDFLSRSYTAKQLKDVGFKVDELADEVVLGSSIFGPKIGFGFYSNLSGNFEPVTMDMWFMRMVGRLTGKLKGFDPEKLQEQLKTFRGAFKERGKDGIYADQFDKELVARAKIEQDAAIELARKVIKAHEKDFKENREAYDNKTRFKSQIVRSSENIIKNLEDPIDAPANGQERRNLRQVVRQFRENIRQETGKDIPPAALQAIVWYPEQELYKALGVKLKVTSQDYAGAMKEALRNENYTDADFERVLKQGAGRTRSVAGESRQEPDAATGAQRQEADGNYLKTIVTDRLQKGAKLPVKFQDSFFASPEVMEESQFITGEVVPSTDSNMSQVAELDFKQKDELTSKILTQRQVQKLAKSIGIDSIVRVTKGTGGYGGAVTPNLIVQVYNPNTQQARRDSELLSEAMTYVYQQDAVPSFQPSAQDLREGSGALGYRFKFTKSLTVPQQTKLYNKLRELAGRDLGFTNVNKKEFNVIDFERGDRNDFSSLMDKFSAEANKIVKLEGREIFGAEDRYEGYDWKKPTTGKTLKERVESLGGGRSNISNALDQYHDAFVDEARNAVSKSGGKPRFSIRSTQPAFRPSDRGRQGISFQDRQPDATSYTGAHYGNQRVDTLLGAKFGTGAKAQEAGRLMRAGDPRLQKRVYFYVPKTDDSMPVKESGTGNYVYSQKFNNILGPGPKMSELFRQANGDSNEFESLVLDSGYDGYASEDYGIMVVLGQDVPVDYEGTVAEVTEREKSGDSKLVFKDNKFYEDIPSNDWLNSKMASVLQAGRNEFDVPRSLGSVTGYFENPVDIPIDMLADLPNTKGEEIKIRQSSVDYARNNPSSITDRPVSINVDPFGKAWIEEGNHRVAMAKAIGLPSLPVKVQYYTGGQRKSQDFAPDNIARLNNKIEPKPRYSLRPNQKEVTKTKPFKDWFRNSKILDKQGNPRVMYHGTARDIDEFRPKQANAIFVTDDPVFAESFSETSEEYMIKEMYMDMDADQAIKVINQAIKDTIKEFRRMKKEKEISAEALKYELENMADVQAKINEAKKQGIKPTWDVDIQLMAGAMFDVIRSQLPSRPNIMPLYVRAENPFDFENPDHINSLRNLIDEDAIFMIEEGSWRTIEEPEVQKVIRDLGYDGFYIRESGRKNLGVYSPNQVKSATGNEGTFDETGRIRYNLQDRPSNAPPQILTKTDTKKTTREAVEKSGRAVMNAIQDNDYMTKKRIEWVDVGSGLSKALSELPLYDPNGTLRGDMIKHAQAQGMNLINMGLVSGTPFLNRDGTISIQRSENNFSRSEYLAEKLSTHPEVVNSGLTGKNFVAEVARGLRAKDIIAADKRTRALGAEQIKEAEKLEESAKQAAKSGNMKAAKSLWNESERLKRTGKENAKMKREFQATPEQIRWAESQLTKVPEVNEILGIWKNINDDLITLWEDTGLLSKEDANEYRRRENYVPFFMANDDLNTEKVFKMAGVGAKTTAELAKLKGSNALRNIWENLHRHYAVMTAAAYENQTRRVSVKQLVGLGGAEITNISDTRGNLKYKEDGVDVNVIVHNPNVQVAFQTFAYELGPVMRFMGAITRTLRAGALINPMFWLRQLIRDPIHATVVSNSGVVTPFHSASNFLKELTTGTEEAEILRQRGVIGPIDSLTDINDLLKGSGEGKRRNPNTIQKALNKILSIHEASDAATRISIFKKAKAKALEQGMSEEQAVDFAVFKARESINFAVKGMHPFLNSLRQMIPFLNATIVGLDTLYRAWRGYALNPEEKAEVKRNFKTMSLSMMAFSAVYALLYSFDDEYNDLPNYTKDNNFLIPIGTGEDRQFIKLAIPYEVGFLFKTVPELAVRALRQTSSGKEIGASLLGGLLHNLPTGGVPIPQAIRPGAEVFVNYSFFTGRPIEGMRDDGLPTELKGEKASEFAKILSKNGLKELSLSPVQIDYITQGYFAELGTFGTELASSLLNFAQGKEPPEKNLEEMPFFKSFMSNPNSSQAVANFYEITKEATQVARGFTSQLNAGRGEAAMEFLEEDDNKKLYASASALRSIRDDMAEIKAQIRLIKTAPSLNPKEKREKINALMEQFNRLAKQGVTFADQIGIR